MKQVQQTCTVDIHLNLKWYVDKRNQEVTDWYDDYPSFWRRFFSFFSSEVMNDVFQQCYKIIIDSVLIKWVFPK